MANQSKADEPLHCFVVGPIGVAGTSERDRADWLLEYIIKAGLECSSPKFRVQRGDDFTDPGMITDQVVNAVLSADLVVADLAGPNANAFYELGIRHMAGGPTIHMAAAGEALPFDVKDYRTIFYDLSSPYKAIEARNQLITQAESIMKAVRENKFKPQNPVSKAIYHQKLASSSDKKDKTIAELMSEIDKLKAKNESRNDVDSMVRKAIGMVSNHDKSHIYGEKLLKNKRVYLGKSGSDYWYLNNIGKESKVNTENPSIQVFIEKENSRTSKIFGKNSLREDHASEGPVENNTKKDRTPESDADEE